MEEHYKNALVVTLTPHLLDIQTMPANVINLTPHKNNWKKGENEKLLKILEDLVDDFINICQLKTEENLLYLSQALLHGIHIVFPPPSVTKDGIPDPISEEKLENGKVL